MLSCGNWTAIYCYDGPKLASVYMLSHVGHIQLFANLWIITRKAPLSMGFIKQEYWSGLPCPPLGYIPDSGIEPSYLMSPALAGMFFTTSATYEVQY